MKIQNNLKIKSLCIICLFLFFPILANATVYYVDQNHPSASDKSPGTEEQPWKTIRYAADVAVAGDTILIKEGKYYEQSAQTDWFRAALTPANSGTTNAPITFKAYPGHKVVIDGPKGPVIGSRSNNYIIWDGFITPKVVAIFNSKAVTILNCEVIGKYGPTRDNHDGIRIQDSENIRVNNCIIHGVKGDVWNSAGIKLYFLKNTIIENCEIYDCTTGIYDKRKGKNNIYRCNIIHDCQYVSVNNSSAGDPKNSQENCQFYQNIIYNIKHGSIQILNYNYNFSVYNNVFYNTSSASICWATNKDSIKSWNNIFLNVGSIYSGDTLKYLTYSDYNCVYSYGSGFGGSKLQTWKNNSDFDDHSIEAGPLFINAEEHDFNLKNNSPCKGAGKDGVNMGCYIKGDETIGPRPQEGSTPPAPPKNLKLINN